MKKIIALSLFLLCVAAVSAQEQADTMYISLSQGRVVKYAVSDVLGMGFNADEMPKFPVADDATAFDKLSPAASVKKLLEKAGAACTDTLGLITITEAQYNEIKQFADNLVDGAQSEYQKYRKCYNWITANVKYGEKYDNGSYVNNDPYPVFTTKKAICQGYANLLHLMLHTQGVPAMVVNGWANSRYLEDNGNKMLWGAGHAWNYVCCDGTWYVSDPTNLGEHMMSNLSQYKTALAPTRMDVVVFKEDDCWFNFYECFLNICKVTTEENVFVVPYSVQGFKVNCFNPSDTIPENVREIYIGENIESIGEGIKGLNEKAPSVEYVTVDSKNKYFSSNEGALFYSADYKPTDIYASIDRNIPAYIPAKLKRLVLKAVEIGKSGIVYDKGSVSKHDGIEEIVFPKETAEITSGAVTNCKNLKIVRVPKGAKYDNAFSSSVQVIEYE